VAAGAGCTQASRPALHVNPPGPPPLPQLQADFRHLPVRRPTLPAWLETQPAGIDVLIASIEQAIERAERDYRENRPEQGRQEFDRAINQLLASGLNFSADPRLEPLLDRLMATLHHYQQSEPNQPEAASGEAPQISPLEELGEIAPAAAAPVLEEKAAAELMSVPHDLPLTINPQVLSFLSFFQTPRGQKIFEHSLERFTQYADMIRSVLREQGLPEDLVYLPLPESGYQPRAMSRAGARGLWQFMPFRGREYGLRVDRWVDERMDPVKSTRAAAEHLRDLYQMFHDWYLVLAAYNAGPLTVARAIERTGYADFWELCRLNALPAETKNYVPIVLAFILAAKAPTLYGLNLPPAAPVEATEDFVPGHAVDLRLVADLAGVDLGRLQQLNPALLGVVTPEDPNFALHVPRGTAASLARELAAIPRERWVGWRLHRVAEGETLATVARQFHVRVNVLTAANHLSASDALQPGQPLLVPAPSVRTVSYYRVPARMTVAAVARLLGVPVTSLRRWNHLRGSRVRAGALLRVYVSVPGARFEQAATRRVHLTSTAAAVQGDPASGRSYRVRPGDTLWSVARRFGTTAEALKRANPSLHGSRLRAGQRLWIPN
jgi:membrane-bound lytic murein transglycosylase D